MNSAQLKQYISSGSLDSVFTELYGADKVAYQRERYVQAIDGFIENYADSDDLRLFSVPGRSEISGNHTDHNHGKVLAASINLDIIAVARKTDTGIVNIKSKGFSPDSVKISEIKVDPDKFFTSFSVIEGSGIRRIRSTFRTEFCIYFGMPRKRSLPRDILWRGGVPHLLSVRLR